MRAAPLMLLRWSPTLGAWCLWHNDRVADHGTMAEMRLAYPKVPVHICGDHHDDVKRLGAQLPLDGMGELIRDVFADGHVCAASAVPALTDQIMQAV